MHISFCCNLIYLMCLLSNAALKVDVVLEYQNFFTNAAWFWWHLTCKLWINFSDHNIVWPRYNIAWKWPNFISDKFIHVYMILSRIENFRLQLAKFSAIKSWWSLKRSNCSTSASQRAAAARDSKTGWGRRIVWHSSIGPSAARGSMLRMVTTTSKL